jgi:peptide deformylase
MAVLDLVYVGDERLRKKAIKVSRIDDSLRKLADDMWETLREARGVGLAAPQVGASRRLILVHVPEDYDEDDPAEYNFTLVNPEIIKSFGRKVGTEGCLSMPGWIGEVPRFEAVTVKAQDLNGRPVRIKAENHLATVLQHEIDHLDGIMYTDRIEDPSTLIRVPDDEYDEVAE